VALHSLASSPMGTHPAVNLAAFLPARTDPDFRPGTNGWGSPGTA